MDSTTENSLTLENLYNEACSEWSDIQDHLPRLRDYSLLVDHVTEFGVRTGFSTRALLAGFPKRMISYDINPYSDEPRIRTATQAACVDWTFVQDNILFVEIEPTDLLFIDTYHTYSQLKAELNLHASKVRRYLILHDTAFFGEVGQDGKPVGLIQAYRELLVEDPSWHVVEVLSSSYGLTVLERRTT